MAQPLLELEPFEELLVDAGVLAGVDDDDPDDDDPDDDEPDDDEPDDDEPESDVDDEPAEVGGVAELDEELSAEALSDDAAFDDDFAPPRLSVL